MRTVNLPIAGAALRRLSMQRTLQHQIDISAGRIRYVREGQKTPDIGRSEALAHEERIFRTISNLQG